jgi:DNA-binding transcriptional MerR regulator
MVLIKEAAERVGVSISALIYYDNIGLLRPTARSGGSYRLYTEDDLLKLRIIVFLKKLRFSLLQIKKLLRGNHLSSKELLECCQLQKAVLSEQAAALQKSFRVVVMVMHECEKTESLDWEALFKIVATVDTQTQVEDTK